MSYLCTFCISVFAALTIIVGFPLGKPSPKPDNLLGISPGSPISEVRTRIGDPLMVRLMPDGSQVTWNRSPSDDAYIMLGQRNGYVTYVRVVNARVGPVSGVTDPFDVILGGNQLGLRTLRGKPQSTVNAGGDQVRQYPGPNQLSWQYTIRDGEVHSIMLTTASESSPAQAMPKTPGGAPTLPTVRTTDPRDGSSMAAAFLVNARDEDEGARFEQFFVKTLPGCGQTWSIDQHARATDHKRHYDRMELACGESGNTRLVFFDITGFFGKVVLPTEVP